MAGLIKKRGIYYVQFFDQNRLPQKKRISLRTTNKRQALKVLNEIELKVSLGCDPWIDDPLTWGKKAKPKVLTLGEARAAFIARKKADNRSENTIRTYEEVLNAFERQVGDSLLMPQIRSDSINYFIRDPRLSSATQHKRFGHLRTFLRWAFDEGLLRVNPLDEVTPAEKPQKLPKALTQTELRAITKELRKQYNEKCLKGVVKKGELIWRIPLFEFAFYTGMRASELARLRWAHIDFDRRLIFIYKQKNKREQTIPLNARAREILESIGGLRTGYVFVSPRGDAEDRSIRCFRENASRAFREARDKAGVRKTVSFHSLRHGFCTRLAESGKSAFVIQQAARHADISTSAKYVHMANEHLKHELDDVFW